jgi:hypothetical protein
MYEPRETSRKILLNRGVTNRILDGGLIVNDPSNDINDFTPIAYDNGKNIVVTYISNKEKAPVGSYIVTSDEYLVNSLSALGEPYYKEIARYARFILYSYNFLNRNKHYTVKHSIRIGKVIFFYSPFAVRSVFNMPEMGPDPLILASYVSIEEILDAQIWTDIDNYG